MGGEQAARTLAEVKLRQLERSGEALDQRVLDAVYQDTLKAYQEQLSAYHSTSNLWDDGIIDPIDTRNALGIALWCFSLLSHAPDCSAGARPCSGSVYFC
jgi:3-methylcrotonyl-CoA carboxylase beta subunit